MKIFSRPTLAERFAKRILDISPTSSAASGLFFSAPRGTGKTTFLRHDLIPVLQDAGALIIYADLWADESAEPSNVIITAIERALSERSVVMDKAASLASALAALSDSEQKLIVLIIDEAQHAVTTQPGDDALFALKAARDELNSSGHFGLRVVCTGSHHDKLAILRSGSDQAFFCAPLVPFPPLGQDYVEWFSAQTTDLPATLPPELVAPLFENAGRHPAILNAAADALHGDPSIEESNASTRFAAEVDRQIQAHDSDHMRAVQRLTALQRAVFTVMVVDGARYAPFESGTMGKYVLVNALTGGKALSPDVPGIERALGALVREGLVWRATNGVYFVEDDAFTGLMMAAGK